MFNSLPPRPIPVPGQNPFAQQIGSQNPLADVIDRYLLSHNIGGSQPIQLPGNGPQPSNIGGILGKVNPGGLMQSSPPVVAPRNPVPSQPNLAQLRSAITQMHAQQMLQRMQVHSQHHNNKIASG